MRLFLYGTLKRGGSNHGFMRGQRFISEAATAPGYRLYDLGGYPGMVAADKDGLSIQGEIWEVDTDALARLDDLEDLDGGEYTRELVPMLPPFDKTRVEGYRYLLPVKEARELGPVW